MCVYKTHSQSVQLNIFPQEMTGNYTPMEMKTLVLNVFERNRGADIHSLVINKPLVKVQRITFEFGGLFDCLCLEVSSLSSCFLLAVLPH